MTSASTLLDQPARPAAPDAYRSPAPRPPRQVPRRPAPRAPRRAGRAIRSAIFWIHLAVGIVTGIVVLVMSATGTALAFQRQMLDWSASRHMVAPAAGAERLPLDTLFARASAVLPEGQQPSSVTVGRGEATPVKFGLSARRYAYADPYTGQLLPASQGLQTFFYEMERWHRAMGLGEGLRGKPGVSVTGASNLAFLFLIATGIFLWFPRQLSWRAFRAVLLFEPRARGRRRDWNWHHVLGLWTAPVLFLLVLSGVFISYKWPTKLLERTLDGEAPAVAAQAAAAPAGPSQPGAAQPAAASAPDAATPAAPVSLEGAFTRAAATTPGWRTISLRPSRAADAPVTVTVSTTTAVRPDRRTALSFDAATAEMSVTPGYATLTPAGKLRSWVRGTHTGEVGGAVGQAVAGIACLAAVVLVWTGVALAWRRFLRSVRRRGRMAAASA